MNIKHRGMLYALGGVLICASGGAALQAQTAAAPAYYVVEVNVRDVDKYKNDYASHVAATVAPYGGRYLAAGGRTESVEGAPPSEPRLDFGIPERGQGRGVVHLCRVRQDQACQTRRSDNSLVYR